jgi:hypothetical protein
VVARIIIVGIGGSRIEALGECAVCISMTRKSWPPRGK